MTSKPSLIVRLVTFSCDRRWIVSGAALLITVLAAAFVAQRFALTTDTDKLLSAKLPYRQREAVFDKAFPDSASGEIVVVVDGATPEIADAAAAALAAKLKAQPSLFPRVERPDAGAFFAKNGLLLESTADVQSTTDQLIAAQPFLGPVSADPSLRGLMSSLSITLQGVSAGQASLQQIDAPMKSLAEALERLHAGQPALFSWRGLLDGANAGTGDRRHVILVGAKLDYSALEPGADASAAIRQDAAALGLDAAHGVRVRLTGSVPLEDDEFATLTHGAGTIAVLMCAAIVVMLWFAVGSPRVIACILATTIVGLVLSAAFGLLAFHRFNVISVAFIPLFVGLGIDFGIQFSVRYRAEHLGAGDPRAALIASGRGMGWSLTLAASAIAAGFLAFGPTRYVGVSQLGLIAGVGMLVALGLTLTLLPALISLARPSGRAEAMVYPQLIALDAFLIRHRLAVVGGGVAAGMICLALTPLLHFDFNPLHLRSAKTESVSTLLDLTKDPDQAVNTIDVLAPSLDAAQSLADRLSKLPEVSQAITLDSFAPPDQAARLAIISDASTLLDFTLDPVSIQPPPSDAQVVTALTSTAQALRQAAGSQADPAAADARRLAGDLDVLAESPPKARADADAALMPGLKALLSQARLALSPTQPVTLRDLPPDLARQWVAPDGRARISVIPRGDSNNNAVLQRFASAVLKVAPNATGAAVSIQQSGDAVVGAFIEAGVLSFVAITVMLLLALRRIRDVAITLAPIVLTGLLTLGDCVLIGQPLNFANIIALPLLFGIGVAFHIYFVMAWRAGGSNLLQSSLTRGVFFSALTTAMAFGSLWVSSHPGTASMGKLLMISLIWTLVSALLFQPALMGAPPNRDDLASGPI